MEMAARKTSPLKRVMDYFRLNRKHGVRTDRSSGRFLEERGYEAAHHSYRTDSWITPRSSANTETKLATFTLRDRARDLIRNNAHANRALTVIVSNTVGTGITGTIKCDSQEKQTKIRKMWDEWTTNKSFDVEERHDFYGLQALLMRTVVEAGECLVKIQKTNKTRIPFSFQLLEPDFLDSFRECRTDDGGYILQGVEFNNQGRRIAYWLFNEHPGGFINMSGYSAVSNRVSADNVFHIFRCDRPGQTRGVSWFSHVMMSLKDLGDFLESHVVKAKISSCYSVFVRDTALPKFDQDTGVVKSARGRNSIDKLSPGSIQYLLPEQSVEFASPPPLDGFSEFTSKMLKTISAGLGITYEAMTGDLEGCNFSSGRMGFIEFQRNLEFWRWQMLIPQFCDPIWQKFKQGLEIQGIDTSDVTIKWVPPRREMIDPSKEIEGIQLGIRTGLYTLSGALSEMGFDPDEHLKEAAEDFKKLDALGLVLDSDPRNEHKTQETDLENQKAE